jgi:hypothetical protein
MHIKFCNLISYKEKSLYTCILLITSREGKKDIVHKKNAPLYCICIVLLEQENKETI